MTNPAIDGVLMIGFGGPTPGCCQRYDPCPGREAACFVRAVVGERPGAQARIDEVAAHYDVFGGYSPFNALTLQQAESVSAALQAKGHAVPVRVGMRFWPPYVDTVLADMAEHGLPSPVGRHPVPLPVRRQLGALPAVGGGRRRGPRRARPAGNVSLALAYLSRASSRPLPTASGGPRRRWAGCAAVPRRSSTRRTPSPNRWRTGRRTRASSMTPRPR